LGHHKASAAKLCCLRQRWRAWIDGLAHGIPMDSKGEISHGWIVFVGFYGWISPFTVKTCFKLLLLPANIGFPASVPI